MSRERLPACQVKRRRACSIRACMRDRSLRVRASRERVLGRECARVCLCVRAHADACVHAVLPAHGTMHEGEGLSGAAQSSRHLHACFLTSRP
eukprot:6194533-Pleurochrysis_carterae.AAC.2